MHIIRIIREQQFPDLFNMNVWWMQIYFGTNLINPYVVSFLVHSILEGKLVIQINTVAKI